MHLPQPTASMTNETTDARSRRGGSVGRWNLAVLLAIAVLAGCSSSTSGTTPTSQSGRADTTDVAPRFRGTTPNGSSAPPVTASPGGPSPDTPGTGDRQLSAKVHLVELAKVTSPVAMTNRPGSPNLYVAEQAGRVRALRPDSDGTSADLADAPVLDISSDVDGRGERGLLGLTFSSDGGTLFTYHTDRRGTIHVSSYRMNSDAVDESTRVDILSIEHPMPNHNGGQLVTGPDGMLYIGVGDGGGSGDPNGNGQNTRTLLGKILRIDPTKPANGKNYGIPPSNPFADGSGAPEVWIYGARNPWRFSFDRETGDLWIGDVGQNEIEEINFLPNIAGEGAGRGANLGWRQMEGSHPYDGGTPPANHVPPVLEYNHDNGECSVIAGFVYRGQAIPALRSVLSYADFCVGPIRGLLTRDGNVLAEASLGAETQQPSSFGQDNEGELYVLSQAGAVYRVTAA